MTWRPVNNTRQFFLTPVMPAMNAVFPVNTQYRAALRTRPSLYLVSRELPDAVLLYALEILDHAHGVSGSIPVVQVVQCGTGKACTREAVLVSPVLYFPAILDLAYDAGLRLEAVVASTTRACILFPAIGTAEAAVHSAGSDQRRGDRGLLCWIHVINTQPSAVSRQLLGSAGVPRVNQ